VTSEFLFENCTEKRNTSSTQIYCCQLIYSEVGDAILIVELDGKMVMNEVES
jgi:hypothetical protein